MEREEEYRGKEDLHIICLCYNDDDTLKTEKISNGIQDENK